MAALVTFVVMPSQSSGDKPLKYPSGRERSTGTSRFGRTPETLLTPSLTEPVPSMSAVMVTLAAVTLIGTVVMVPVPFSPAKPSARSSASPTVPPLS